MHVVDLTELEVVEGSVLNSVMPNWPPGGYICGLGCSGGNICGWWCS